jgi:hypothetical protein
MEPSDLKALFYDRINKAINPAATGTTHCASSKIAGTLRAVWEPRLDGEHDRRGGDDHDRHRRRHQQTPSATLLRLAAATSTTRARRTHRGAVA